MTGFGEGKWVVGCDAPRSLTVAAELVPPVKGWSKTGLAMAGGRGTAVAAGGAPALEAA